MQHTPTPWRRAGNGLQIKANENGYLVAVVEGPDRRARGKEWQEDHDYCHGNAAFIVKACNAHDQLVAALKVCRDLIYAEVADGKFTEQAALAREALAAAGAE
jgi:hypothetical protein